MIPPFRLASQDFLYSGLGLRPGALDYVVKPFSPTELAARIRASLRRREVSTPLEPYVYGDLTVDCPQRRATLDGQPVPLEYRLLAELAANARRVVTYERVLERVWGKRGGGDLRPMRAVVVRLRRRLGEDSDRPTYVFNEPRVGYWVPAGGAGGGGIVDRRRSSNPCRVEC